MVRRFRLIDVFTDCPFAGNQLAVVLDADGVTESVMQRVAREFGFSETTFVVATERPGCDFRVRIFTPLQELPMAGHPTLGTALVLQDEGRLDARAVFELGVGPIEVSVGRGRAEIAQLPPEFGAAHPDLASLAAALSLSAADVGPGPQVVSCGVPFLIVPVRSLDAMRRLRPRRDHWDDATAAVGVQAVLCFSQEAEQPGVAAHVRMFAPAFGVDEDPATGSAAGPLGCFMWRRGLGRPPFDFEQGLEIGRPSLLHVDLKGDAGGITGVRVAGAGVIWGTGELDLS